MYKGKVLDTRTEGLNELPVAVIKQEDLDLIFGFVLNHPYEINGRGYVRPVGNVFNIENIFILSQKTIGKLSWIARSTLFSFISNLILSTTPFIIFLISTSS